MSRSMASFLLRFLLTVLAIAAASQSATAATIVTINFNGSATGASSGDFSGAISYDQSLGSTSAHTFVFTGSTKEHGLVYNTQPSGPESGINSRCEPYIITTFNSTFTLTATLPRGTTVTIVLPTSAPMSATSLPGCSVFPSPPSNSTFKLTGGFNYTGQITSTSCTGPAAAEPAPALCYVVACPAPAPCPVYACNQQPACFLTRLFSRRSHRLFCW